MLYGAIEIWLNDWPDKNERPKNLICTPTHNKRFDGYEKIRNILPSWY